MNPADAADETPEREIARLLEDITAYAQRFKKSRERLLDVQHISHQTGIARDRVHALLRGARVEREPDEPKARETFRRGLVVQRLQFLRQTRLKQVARRNGTVEEQYSLRNIEEVTKISYQHVSKILNGESGASADHLGRLEQFFGVEPGFCLKTEDVALVGHLRQMVDVDLPKLATQALLQGGRVALRNPGGEIDHLRDILPVLDQLLTQQQDGNRH
ncbi:helix-turn-helix transcriptional regulator [Streptomyces spectabilis]|uniref:helix-turn-helix transcriptional regulator n=1 Tax=Streptomyces spectabilis TaxID=68270 RepID=UPI00340AFE54